MLAECRNRPWLQRSLARPGWMLAALGAMSLTIEVCQQWPEFFFPGHAIGEFIRNLANALVAAVLFNWILVEIPAQRRRRLAYSRHLLALQLLTQSGPHSLAYYRGVADLVGADVTELDAWNTESIERCVRAIYEKAPTLIHERRQLLGVQINALQLALDGLEPASYFLDPDVAVALALFPAEKGIHQLQPPDASDPEPWKREVHIAGSLLEASRRLYGALTSCAPYLELDVEKGCVTMSDNKTWHVQLEDLVRDSGKTGLRLAVV